MKPLLFCIGTRPEAIKLAPLILEAKKRGLNTQVVTTGQHREMLIPFIQFFGIHVDHSLDVLRPNQSLSSLTAQVLNDIHPVILKADPSWIITQGDTTTAFGCSLAGFYHKIPVAHVEAGLRTFDRYSPFPEEMNRKLIGAIAELHFAPTQSAKKNLALEGITNNVWVTGNTGVDALRITLDTLPQKSAENQKQILVTCHRRENHGEPLVEICDAILTLVKKFPELKIVFPVHLNPNVQKVVHEKLGQNNRIQLTAPMNYTDFASAMRDSYLLLTDSGGVQEEAPYLQKPIFVLRESTERPEGVEAGVSILVGSDSKKIVESVSRALTDETYYRSFQKSSNPYGDGFASARILDEILKFSGL